MCRHCRLGEEDLLHLLSRCPAFYYIRESTINSLKDIIIKHLSVNTWEQYFKDWLFVLKTLVCVESVLKTAPALTDIQDSIEGDNGCPLSSDKMCCILTFIEVFRCRSDCDFTSNELLYSSYLCSQEERCSFQRRIIRTQRQRRPVHDRLTVGETGLSR